MSYLLNSLDSSLTGQTVGDSHIRSRGGARNTYPYLYGVSFVREFRRPGKLWYPRQPESAVGDLALWDNLRHREPFAEALLAQVTPPPFSLAELWHVEVPWPTGIKFIHVEAGLPESDQNRIHAEVTAERFRYLATIPFILDDYRMSWLDLSPGVDELESFLMGKGWQIEHLAWWNASARWLKPLVQLLEAQITWTWPLAV